MRRAVAILALVSLAAFGGAIAQENPSNAERASRWVVQFDSGSFTLLERVEATKVLPPSDQLPASEAPPSGFWYELRSAEDETLYRRIVDDPVRLVFEGPSMDDPDGGGEEIPTAAGSASRTSKAKPSREKAGPGKVTRMPMRSMEMKLVRSETVPPVRDEAIPQNRVFTLLTPFAEEGQSLVLFASPLEPNSQAMPAVEVARFTIEPEGPAARGGE